MPSPTPFSIFESNGSYFRHSNYSSDQQAKLDALAAIHLQRVHQKSSRRLQIETQVREALDALQTRESLAANEALALGVSKTKIGRAMGTSNWDTLSAVLARTARA